MCMAKHDSNMRSLIGVGSKEMPRYLRSRGFVVMTLSCPSLLGETRPILEQAGARGCKASQAGKLLFLGPERPLQGTVASESGILSTSSITRVIFCFASFLIRDFSQFIDLTFLCDAEPWKANSMAFYKIDVVCFNCK